MSASPPNIQLAPLESERDIERVIALETASYPTDEAATPAKIHFRQQTAGAFFQVASLASSATAGAEGVVGFVNGTLTAHDELTDETMSEHDPHGTMLCIHSVVVDSVLRGRGIAAAMLQEYVRMVLDQQPHVQRIALIAKAYLVGFYIRCGFRVTRLSPVVHGKDPWFELVLDATAARRLSVVQVDAFSSEIFDGNPAAVVVMRRALFDKHNATPWMQNVAKETNLSETAYVARRDIASQRTMTDTTTVVDFDLRWFTPLNEIALCGHATLASAFVLFGDGHVPAHATIHFHTLSGILKCTQETTTDGKKWIAMDFPMRELTPAAPDLVLEDLAKGLNVQVSDFIAIKQTQTSDLLVHLPTATYATVVPNFDLLARVVARGIVVTAEKGPNVHGVDFQSRFFAPRVGVNEDPVTGSAHCALAGYWSALLGKTSLYAHQNCPLRGGHIRIDIPSTSNDRVLLKGQAVVSLRGSLFTSP